MYLALFKNPQNSELALLYNGICCVCVRLNVYTPNMYTWELINNKQLWVPGGWLIKAEDILFIKSFYTVI